MFTVYRIYCTTSNKSYIGITKDPNFRWKRHLGCYKDTAISRALRKYGREAFLFIILDKAISWKDACKKEKHYISEFDTKSPTGYNLTDGGEGTQGLCLSSEVKSRMSKSRTGEKHPNWGKHLSKETRRKIGKSHTGKTASIETRGKLSIAGRKRTQSKETREKISKNNKGKHSHQLLGRKHTEESKKKMSLGRSGIPMAEETKKKLSIINTGKKHSEEIRKKISDKNKGENHPNWGKHLPKTTSHKISETLKGTQAGEKNRQAKLTESKVIDIRKCYQTGKISQSQLAKKYNVYQSTIGSIVNRKTWTHI